MSFFKQFPRTLYLVDDTLVNIPDLFRRVKPNELFDNMAYLNEYEVQDGQDPYQAFLNNLPITTSLGKKSIKFGHFSAN